MQPETIAPEHGALLVAEIGFDQTHVTLIDIVDQTYRLVARASTASTFGPPDNDPSRAIITALRQIETMASRELLREEDLIFPQDEAGNGVDGVVATTNAVGPMPVAIAGLSQHASVRSATHAARSTYTTVLEPLALDADSLQLGRHITGLAQLKPEVIILAGGIEGGAVSPSQRLAHIVHLLAQHAERKPLVIYAGNSAAAEQVRQIVGDAATVEVTDNLQPKQKQSRLEPTRFILRRYFRERYVAELPGAEYLKKLRVERIGSAAEDQGLMVRFLHQRYGRNVLALTIDGMNTTCILASDGHYSEAVFGRLGYRLSALEVLRVRGFAALQRWLPFEVSEAELRNRLLNRALRPRQIATDLDDLLLDYALLREAAHIAYTNLRDEQPNAPYDLVIAGGAFADAPRPGLAALALLDALQPTHKDSALAINLYLDRFSLLAASGALAQIDTDAAACLLEMDALNNMPLATVIVPHGDLAAGKKLADIELTPTQGQPIIRAVNAGEIVRLPLARGKRATLRIKPVGGVAIGDNRPGEEVLSNEAEIMGSALGVIFDARPRPLSLPTEAEARRDTLLRWMNGLDALPPATVFAPAEQAQTNGTPAEDQGQSEAVPVVANSVEPADDVQSLREGLVMQPQPKRGLFRRK